MDRTYQPLPSHPLSPGGNPLVEPPAKRVTPDSPAIEVMTDLAQVPAVTMTADATLADANRYMMARGVRSLFVVDAGGDAVGLITATDVLGERALRAREARGVRHDELRVGDVMTPAASVVAFHLRDVLPAKVGHVVASLKASGRHHALVAETMPGGRERIRGIFSVTQIARQLGEPLEVAPLAITFAEVGQALGGA